MFDQFRLLIAPDLLRLGITAPLAFGAVFLLLRWLDRLSGVEFRRDVLEEMRKGNDAMADYYGRRYLGACILVGFLVLKGL